MPNQLLPGGILVLNEPNGVYDIHNVDKLISMLDAALEIPGIKVIAINLERAGVSDSTALRPFCEAWEKALDRGICLVFIEEGLDRGLKRLLNISNLNLKTRFQTVTYAELSQLGNPSPP